MMLEKPNTARRRPMRYWIRKVHIWSSVICAVPLIAFSITGAALNHKSLFSGSSGGAPKPAAKGDPSLVPISAYTLETINDIPLSFANVIVIAREQMGDVPLDKIELKWEKDRLVYKIRTDRRRAEERELQIDALSGSIMEKGEAPHEGPVGKTAMDTMRLMKEIHNGKLFGAAGTLLLDVSALLLIVSAVSGLWLFIKSSILK